MVARLLWEQDAAGSNPVTPTISSVHNASELWTLSFLFLYLNRLFGLFFSVSVSIILLRLYKRVPHYDTFTAAPCKDVSGLCEADCGICGYRLPAVNMPSLSRRRVISPSAGMRAPPCVLRSVPDRATMNFGSGFRNYLLQSFLAPFHSEILLIFVSCRFT